MNHECESDGLIELGVVSSDTKGGQVGINDFENGLQLAPGLTDD